MQAPFGMEVQIMAEIETAITDGVVGELEADDGTKAPADTSPLHGGGATVSNMHYGPGTRPMHSGATSLHGGTGTRPLDAGWNVLSLDSHEAPARPSKMQIREERRVTAASLRAFATGYIEPVGFVDGLDTSHLARARQVVVEREAEARRRRTRAAETALHDMLNVEERKRQ